jgi:hypothetical protein
MRARTPSIAHKDEEGGPGSESEEGSAAIAEIERNPRSRRSSMGDEEMGIDEPQTVHVISVAAFKE